MVPVYAATDCSSPEDKIHSIETRPDYLKMYFTDVVVVACDVTAHVGCLSQTKSYFAVRFAAPADQTDQVHDCPSGLAAMKNRS